MSELTNSIQNATAPPMEENLAPIFYCKCGGGGRVKAKFAIVGNDNDKGNAGRRYVSCAIPKEDPSSCIF
jgi:hypothetical protein